MKTPRRNFLRKFRLATPFTPLAVIVLLLFQVGIPYVAAAKSPATLWFRAYGGPSSSINSVKQTADGGFVAAGYTTSFGAGSVDALVVRLDSTGRIVWQGAYGGADVDTAQWVEQTRDGQFIVAGGTGSFDNGYIHSWVFKLDLTGNIVWQGIYGGTGSKGRGYASVVHETSDGGFIVGANIVRATTDALVLKLDPEGEVIWQRVYGGEMNDGLASVEQASDGGFVAGGTGSFGSGFANGWVLRLNATGDILWQKTYVGLGSDLSYSMSLTSDGRIVAAGLTSSFGAGLEDAWVLVLDAEGTALWQKAIGTWGVDYAFSVEATLDGGIVVGGLGYEGALLVKLSRDGDLVWKRAYGLIGEEVHSVFQTSEGGLVIAGNIGVHHRRTGFVAKLDSDGAIPGCWLSGSSTSIVTDASEVTTVMTTVSPGVVEEFNTVTTTSAESTRNNRGGMLLCLGK